MKILLYVHLRTALACGTTTSGEVDHVVSDALAAEIVRLDLVALAYRWSLDDEAFAVPGTHRLTCACATDASVLDALGSLKHRLEIAEAWGKAVVLTGVVPDRIPRRVTELWDKHPLALYRDLLGDRVAAAVRLVQDGRS